MVVFISIAVILIDNGKHTEKIVVVIIVHKGDLTYFLITLF